MFNKSRLEYFIECLTAKPLDPYFKSSLLLVFNSLRLQASMPISISRFTDAQLRSVQQPTLLRIGAQDIAFSPSACVERAKRLIQHLNADIVPEAGHFLPGDQPELMAKRILAHVLL